MIMIPKKTAGRGLLSNLRILVKARQQIIPMVIIRVHGKGVPKSLSFIEYIFCEFAAKKMPKCLFWNNLFDEMTVLRDITYQNRFSFIVYMLLTGKY